MLSIKRKPNELAEEIKRRLIIPPRETLEKKEFVAIGEDVYELLPLTVNDILKNRDVVKQAVEMMYAIKEIEEKARTQIKELSKLKGFILTDKQIDGLISRDNATLQEPEVIKFLVENYDTLKTIDSDRSKRIMEINIDVLDWVKQTLQKLWEIPEEAFAHATADQLLYAFQVICEMLFLRPYNTTGAENISGFFSGSYKKTD